MRIINVSTSFARVEDDAASGSPTPFFAFIEATMVKRIPEVGVKTVLTVCLISLWENVVIHIWAGSLGRIN
jgi:hypothetical protein